MQINLRLPSYTSDNTSAITSIIGFTLNAISKSIIYQKFFKQGIQVFLVVIYTPRAIALE
jgi:hypothetical protein